jgi:hypothetical protein
MGDKREFLRFIGNLCAYFERKQPSPQTMDFWWEELQEIPSEFYHTIRTYLHDLPMWPRNLPFQVRAVLCQIRPKSQEQDHQAHYYPWKYAKADCGYCQGEGFTRDKATVSNKKGDNSINLTARVICPRCVEPQMIPF